MQVSYSGSNELSLSKNLLYAPSPLPLSEASHDAVIVSFFIILNTSTTYPSIDFIYTTGANLEENTHVTLFVIIRSDM
jgi:hypothetical protein